MSCIEANDYTAVIAVPVSIRIHQPRGANTMHTRISVTIVTILFGTLVCTDVYGQLKLGRAALEFKKKEKSKDERNSERNFRRTKAEVVRADHRQSDKDDGKKKVTSRHYHSGSNTLRLASAEASDCSGCGSSDYAGCEGSKSNSHPSSVPHEFTEPQPWIENEFGGGIPTSCDTCGIQPCCCRPAKYRVFADAMYLRPGNIDLVYSVERTGCDPNLDSPTGQLGIVSPEYDLGVRFGFAAALDECTTGFATFTKLESSTMDSITATGANVLHSQVTNPNTGICADNSLFANAQYDINFDTIDAGFARTLRQDCNSVFRALGGFRYAQLEQEFRSQQTVNAELGTTTVVTDVDFEGIGVSLGLDGESQTCKGLKFYGRGLASLVGGDSKADLRETSQFGGAAAIAADYDDFRVVTILEAEIGVGWQSKSGRFGAHAGYQAMAWLETITTADFIHGVQQSAFNDLGDLVMFSGFVLRAEARF